MGPEIGSLPEDSSCDTEGCLTSVMHILLMGNLWNILEMIYADFANKQMGSLNYLPGPQVDSDYEICKLWQNCNKVKNLFLQGQPKITY